MEFEEAALFGSPSPGGEADNQRPAAQHVDLISDWQVQRLRDSLDALGLVEQADRQALIQRLLGRRLASLREVRPEEFVSLLEQMRRPADRAVGRSEWDDREGDTWIDRL